MTLAAALLVAGCTSDVPGPSGTTAPVSGPSDEPSVPAKPEAVLFDAADLETLMLGSGELASALPDLGVFKLVDSGQLEWGLSDDSVVQPSEECRRAITVVLEEPAAFEGGRWSSGEVFVSQEVILLADAAAAQNAFTELAATLDKCDEWSAQLPDSESDWYKVGDRQTGTGAFPSVRVAGQATISGGSAPWLEVEVLVGNALVRIDVSDWSSTDVEYHPADPSDAAALDAALQAHLADVISRAAAD